MGVGSMPGDLGRRVLPDSGLYRVEVFSDGTATGAYSLTLHPVPPPTTTEIAFDAPVAGTVAAIGEWHEYTFGGTAGQTVYLESRTEPSSQLLWRLFGPSGFVAIGTMAGDLGRRVLRDAGPYRIEVFSDETATGPFGFVVHAVPIVPPRAIEIGDTVSGTIRSIGERHAYTFIAADGTVIDPTGEGACIDGLGWRLVAPGGRTLAIAPTCRGLGLQTLEAGSYTIEVGSDGTATGEYRFTLRAGP
jgi:hypothetical protein